MISSIVVYMKPVKGITESIRISEKVTRTSLPLLTIFGINDQTILLRKATDPKAK